MKLYRVTVSRIYEGLVWAEDEAAAREYEDAIVDDDCDYDDTVSAREAQTVCADERDEVPYGSPGGRWTVAQLLAGEHEQPLPGPPESLATIAAWLDSAAHRGEPVARAGTVEIGGATYAYTAMAHGLLAVRGGSPLDLEPTKHAVIVGYLTPREYATRGRIAWADLDRACRDVPLDGEPPLVPIGPARLDARVLRRWVWGAASVAGEDVDVEWAGPYEHVRVWGAEWMAVAMPVRADGRESMRAMPIAREAA